MKKYKLIKEYPGSPKINTIIDTECYTKHNSGIYHNASEYPEFWEEVVEKNYELLSFRRLEDDCIFYITTNGTYRNAEGTRFFNEELFLTETNRFFIHSVKRLSDGEVFTVGDKIYTNDFKPTKLERITIRNNGSLAMWGKYHSGILGEVGLKTCLAKKPLFTTEDGVDIYEGDKYYYPTSLYKISSEVLPIKNEISNESWNNLMRYSQSNNPKFSTKEAAEDYILMNRPTHLSVAKIMNIINSSNFGNLVDNLLAGSEAKKHEK